MKMGMAVKIICGIGGVVAASIGAAILHAKSKKVAETICKVAHVEEAEKQEKIEKTVEKVTDITEKATTGLVFIMPIIALRAVAKMQTNEAEVSQSKVSSLLHANDNREIESIWDEIVPTTFGKQRVTKYKDSDIVNIDIFADDGFDDDFSQQIEYYNKWVQFVPESEWKFYKEVSKHENN